MQFGQLLYFISILANTIKHILIVASCILKIHWILLTNKCT